MHFLHTLLISGVVTFKMILKFCFTQAALSSSIFGLGLQSHATSTPFNPALHNYQATPASGDGSTLQGATYLHGVTHSTGSSGISSIRSEISSSNPTPVPQSYMPVYVLKCNI